MAEKSAGAVAQHLLGAALLFYPVSLPPRLQEGMLAALSLGQRASDTCCYSPSRGRLKKPRAPSYFCQQMVCLHPACRLYLQGPKSRKISGRGSGRMKVR